MVSYRGENTSGVFHYLLGCFEGTSLSITTNAAPYITHKPPESELARVRGREKKKQTVEEGGEGMLIASIDCSIVSYTFFHSL